MPRYALRLEPALAGEPDTTIQDFENDEVAVHVARRILGTRRASLHVGRLAGDDVEWLGLWRGGERDVAWRDRS